MENSGEVLSSKGRLPIVNDLDGKIGKSISESLGVVDTIEAELENVGNQTPSSLVLVFNKDGLHSPPCGLDLGLAGLHLSDFSVGTNATFVGDLCDVTQCLFYFIFFFFCLVFSCTYCCLH